MQLLIERREFYYSLDHFDKIKKKTAPKGNFRFLIILHIRKMLISLSLQSILENNKLIKLIFLNNIKIFNIVFKHLFISESLNLMQISVMLKM